METKFLDCLKISIALANFFKLAHWNVRGMFFYSYHKLFEDLYQKIYAHIDPLAELASIRGVAINSDVFIEPAPITSSSPEELVHSSIALVDQYRECLELLLDELDSLPHRSTTIAIEEFLASLDIIQYLLEASL